jgi:hypothetical protein
VLTFAGFSCESVDGNKYEKKHSATSAKLFLAASIEWLTDILLNTG